MARTKNQGIDLGPGNGYLSGTHGRGVYGLCTALGSDVLLGGKRHRFPVWLDTNHRRRPFGMDSWRLFNLGGTLNRFFALHVVACL